MINEKTRTFELRFKRSWKYGQSYTLTLNCDPLNQEVLFEYKQMTCSPGVWEVKEILPSAEYTLDRIVLSSVSRTSTCIPIPGELGAKPPDRGSNNSTL